MRRLITDNERQRTTDDIHKERIVKGRLEVFREFFAKRHED